MAELSRFFDSDEIVKEDGSIEYVPSYSARDFSDYFATFIGNGVFAQPADQLKVYQKEGLTITVKAGKAWIEGHQYELTEDTDLTLAPNITSNVQVVKVVCVLLRQESKIITQIVQGSESMLPVNDGVKHELVLATFNLPVGSTNITNAMITDRRPQNEYCGFVATTITDIKTTDLFSQYDDMFNTWFDKVKDQFASVEMGNVISQLNNLTEVTGKLQGSGLRLVDVTDVFKTGWLGVDFSNQGLYRLNMKGYVGSYAGHYGRYTNFKLSDALKDGKTLDDIETGLYLIKLKAGTSGIIVNYDSYPHERELIDCVFGFGATDGTYVYNYTFGYFNTRDKVSMMKKPSGWSAPIPPDVQDVSNNLIREGSPDYRAFCEAVVYLETGKDKLFGSSSIMVLPNWSSVGSETRYGQKDVLGIHSIHRIEGGII